MPIKNSGSNYSKTTNLSKTAKLVSEKVNQLWTVYCQSIDHLLARAISRRYHASIISLDFAKAFDRIGIQSILNQLAIWKTGPKITNYIKNYMTNRKILARIKSDLSPFSAHPKRHTSRLSTFRDPLCDSIQPTSRKTHSSSQH